MEPFIEFSIIIFTTTIISILFRLLNQPLIIAYIVSGIFLGPYLLNLLQSNEFYYTLSHFGLSLLLFIVGLNLSLKSIKEFGKHSLILGISQILITFIFGLFILIFGFNIREGVLISICLAFSSTAVVLKLLYDKKLIDTLAGKITTGILIIQDIVVAIVLILFSNNNFNYFIIIEKILLGTGFVIMTLIVSNTIIRKIFDIFSKNIELLILISIAWCFAISVFSLLLGFSIETGALFAGISLSNLPQRYEIEHNFHLLSLHYFLAKKYYL